MVVEKWLLLVVAVAIDVFIEYPNSFHPTVWIGNLIIYIDKKYKRKNNNYDLLIGSLSALLAYFVAGLAGFLVCKTLSFGIVGLLLYIYFLKSTFSVGLLIKKVHSCSVDDEDILRKRVSEIVSRDVSIKKPYLYSAAIESGAENLVDSIVSPFLYYIIFGLPGAMIYRAINTADNLLGYNNERYKKFGKVAALIDYAANYIPARLFLFIELLIYGLNFKKDLRIKKGLRINGKYPMSLFAKLLNLRLVKKGSYVLGSGRLPNAEDVKKASIYLIFLSYIFISVTLLISYVFSLPRWC